MLVRHSKHRVHWLPEFIRQERVKQGLSQRALANQAGGDAKSVSNFKTGYYKIGVVFAMERILAVLGYALIVQRKIDS